MHEAKLSLQKTSPYDHLLNICLLLVEPPPSERTVDIEMLTHQSECFHMIGRRLTDQIQELSTAVGFSRIKKSVFHFITSLKYSS